MRADRRNLLGALPPELQIIILKQVLSVKFEVRLPQDPQLTTSWANDYTEAAKAAGDAYACLTVASHHLSSLRDTASRIFLPGCTLSVATIGFLSPEILRAKPFQLIQDIKISIQSGYAGLRGSVTLLSHLPKALLALLRNKNLRIVFSRGLPFPEPYFRMYGQLRAYSSNSCSTFTTWLSLSS